MSVFKRKPKAHVLKYARVCIYLYLYDDERQNIRFTCTKVTLRTKNGNLRDKCGLHIPNCCMKYFAFCSVSLFRFLK